MNPTAELPMIAATTPVPVYSTKPVAKAKPLPETFDHWGSQWELVEREGDVALYTQTLGSGICYNVFVIQNENDEEAIPKPSQWGIMAWTYNGDSEGSLLAQERFHSVSESYNPKRAA